MTTDKVAVITGGGAPLGLACAQELSRRGLRLLLIDQDLGQPAQALADQVAAGRVVLGQSDLEDVPALRRAIDGAADRFGRIDVLANCVLEPGPDGCWEVDEAAWQRCLRVNMKLPFFALQACVPHMRQVGGGRVVNLSSSLSAYTDGRHGLVFGLAKAGLNSMTRQWAVDLCLDNIQANSLWIGPGRPEDLPRPQAVARFVAWLALDATPYLNGAQIPVDGGAALFRQGRLLEAPKSVLPPLRSGPVLFGGPETHPQKCPPSAALRSGTFRGPREPKLGSFVEVSNT
ncbi:MAG: SDR family oxidoreductase [Propionibacteriaceae bacterium]|jgi:NAD(P)-dependent dehydrogenase (short-subunit alcohol dehydrogenase family)|nr:SDR family oxidoreductase [Propionibacteriaceae bacterium]